MRPVRSHWTSKRSCSSSHGRSSHGLDWWPRTTTTRGRREFGKAGSLESASVRIAIEAPAAAEVPARRRRHVRELLRALAGLHAPHEYVLLPHQPWDGATLDDRL